MTVTSDQACPWVTFFWQGVIPFKIPSQFWNAIFLGSFNTWRSSLAKYSDTIYAPVYPYSNQPTSMTLETKWS